MSEKPGIKGFEKVPTTEGAKAGKSGASLAVIAAPAVVGEDAPPPKSLTLGQLFTVLRPYFWPYGGTDGYLLNRIRAISTYCMISISKTCSVFAPFQLIIATNALVSGDYDAAVAAIVRFCLLKFATSFFKEMQSAMYLKVKQQATIELAELVFTHVHNLSLHWHLSKKTGNTIRVIDRGYEAADRLVTWLFLSLVPALAECFAVCLLFLLNYTSPVLAIIVRVMCGSRHFHPCCRPWSCRHLDLCLHSPR
jgi:ABC-type multidrug transport system fused ATPase/permease subunit